MYHTKDPFLISDPDVWAKLQWSSASLGDRRRQRRAVRLGAAIAARSGASLPKQAQTWGDLKAAYRLLNEEDVTHERLSAPHWQATRLEASRTDGPVLFVQDTSELDFTLHWALQGGGRLNDRGYGFLMHSCLTVLPDTANPEIVGLAYQSVWAREVWRRQTDTKVARQKRRNEADVWAETVEVIGPAPESATWVSVGDRASDVFSYVRRARARGWHCLLRVNQNRRILTNEGVPGFLKPFVRALPPRTTKTTVLQSKGLPDREVVLQIAWTPLTLEPPANRAEKYESPQSGWCIRVWNDEEPMEWILFSTVPVASEAAALEQVGWYEHRWLIEEYHKCLKTGCAIEKRQLTTADGLLALLGFLAITAVRLMQLRCLSRTNPEGRAGEAGIDPLFLKLVAARLHQEPAALSVGQFWRGVAMLGGFIGRKSDGEPGWQTLWDGWLRLQDMCAGAVWMETELARCG